MPKADKMHRAGFEPCTSRSGVFYHWTDAPVAECWNKESSLSREDNLISKQTEDYLNYYLHLSLNNILTKQV